MLFLGYPFVFQNLTFHRIDARSRIYKIVLCGNQMACRNIKTLIFQLCQGKFESELSTNIYGIKLN